MGMKVNQPRMFSLTNDRNEQYLNGLRECVNGDTQMVLCILTNNKKGRYDSIKKFCCIDRPGKAFIQIISYDSVPLFLSRQTTA